MMNYPTSDLGFAALLHAIKYPIGPINSDEPEHIIFSFEIPSKDVEKITILYEAYKAGDANVDARTYYRSLKDLKFLVKSVNGEQRTKK